MGDFFAPSTSRAAYKVQSIPSSSEDEVPISKLIPVSKPNNRKRKMQPTAAPADTKTKKAQISAESRKQKPQVSGNKPYFRSIL